MNLYWISDILGIIGVGLILLSFFMLQTGKITSDSMFYLYSNFFGAMALLFSLYFHWNLASVIIEIMWVIISLYGIVRVKYLKKHK